MSSYQSLAQAIEGSVELLKVYGAEVDSGHWQGVTTQGRPDLVTKEIVNLDWSAPMPAYVTDLEEQTAPNLPWAEDHFQERVSRVPSNPGEEYKNWPWWRGQELAFEKPGSGPDEVITEIFTHTYQERFWPKKAGNLPKFDGPPAQPMNRGIRYPYGDLDDVVNLLRREPQTRQATFPIFFPEDTGAVHGGRIPCTLHYHFLMRRGKLNLWYPIRSCDAVRHFRDDIYMAVRLAQWVLEELGQDAGPEAGPWEFVELGWLYFNAYSFHVHMGDYHLL